MSATGQARETEDSPVQRVVGITRRSGDKNNLIRLMVTELNVTKRHFLPVVAPQAVAGDRDAVCHGGAACISAKAEGFCWLEHWRVGRDQPSTLVWWT